MPSSAKSWLIRALEKYSSAYDSVELMLSEQLKMAVYGRLQRLTDLEAIRPFEQETDLNATSANAAREPSSTLQVAGAAQQTPVNGKRKRRDRRERSRNAEKFDRLVGGLMNELRGTAKDERNAKIAQIVDAKGFLLEENLEKFACDDLKAHNSSYPDGAVTTFVQAINNRKRQGAVNKRFHRATENYTRFGYANKT